MSASRGQPPPGRCRSSAAYPVGIPAPAPSRSRFRIALPPRQIRGLARSFSRASFADEVTIVVARDARSRRSVQGQTFADDADDHTLDHHGLGFEVDLDRLELLVLRQ